MIQKTVFLSLSLAIGASILSESYAIGSDKSQDRSIRLCNKELTDLPATAEFTVSFQVLSFAEQTRLLADAKLRQMLHDIDQEELLFPTPETRDIAKQAAALTPFLENQVGYHVLSQALGNIGKRSPEQKLNTLRYAALMSRQQSTPLVKAVRELFDLTYRNLLNLEYIDQLEKMGEHFGEKNPLRIASSSYEWEISRKTLSPAVIDDAIFLFIRIYGPELAETISKTSGIPKQLMQEFRIRSGIEPPGVIHWFKNRVRWIFKRKKSNKPILASLDDPTPFDIDRGKVPLLINNALGGLMHYLQEGTDSWRISDTFKNHLTSITQQTEARINNHSLYFILKVLHYFEQTRGMNSGRSEISWTNSVFLDDYPLDYPKPLYRSLPEGESWRNPNAFPWKNDKGEGQLSVTLGFLKCCIDRAIEAPTQTVIDLIDQVYPNELDRRELRFRINERWGTNY